MNNEMMDCATATTKETVGKRLLDMAKRIASEAEVAAKVTQDRLSPITRIPEPCLKDSCKNGEIEQAWPSYFGEFRDVLQDISRSIRLIKATINDVEL